jgi:hypothetical protein
MDYLLTVEYQLVLTISGRRGHSPVIFLSLEDCPLVLPSGPHHSLDTCALCTGYKIVGDDFDTARGYPVNYVSHVICDVCD